MEIPWIILISTSLWFGIQCVVDYVVPKMFPSKVQKIRETLEQNQIETYNQLRTRIISLCFCLTALPAAIYLLCVHIGPPLAHATDTLSDKSQSQFSLLAQYWKSVFGAILDLEVEHSGARALVEWTVGYFIWDLVICIMESWGIGFLVHAILCLLVYSLSLLPFALWAGVACLLFELSTPFGNLLAICRGLGVRSGSFFYFVSVGFTLCFGLSRIAFGVPFCLAFCSQVLVYVFACFDSSASLTCSLQSLGLYLLLLFSNLILTLLNCYWFIAIIRGVCKILFAPAPITPQPKAQKGL